MLTLEVADVVLRPGLVSDDMAGVSNTNLAVYVYISS